MVKIKVIFRKFVDSGEIIANFPEIPYMHYPDLCVCVSAESFTNGACNPESIFEDTEAVEEAEYAPLLRSLAYSWRGCEFEVVQDFDQAACLKIRTELTRLPLRFG